MRRFIVMAVLLIGIALVPAVPAAAQTSPEITQGLCAGVNLNVNDTNCNDGGDAVSTINDLIRKTINLLSVIVGVVAVIMIMVGGFRYITSGGSDTGVTSAKNTILYAIIGLIIVALAQLLVRFVLRQVGTV
ncbi:MAG TPA: pilin [Candidatus Saccharimonadales bacterium]|nr:pilin [Candidatus Saccharimonadales bacterium]